MNHSSISRRRLLQGGAMLLAAPLLGPHLSWASTPGASAQPLYWITQPEIAASVAYAAAACSGQRFSLSGKIEHLLYRELVPALRARPMGLAGLTDAATLFCIETVASDHGLRMAHRAPVVADLSEQSGVAVAGQDRLFTWLMLPRRQARRVLNEVSA